jgi:hypothetical protein
LETSGAIRGKRFGSDDEVIEEVAASVGLRQIQYKTGSMLLFLAGARLLKLTEIM